MIVMIMSRMILKQTKWFEKKEPETQIEILREIAIKGFQSKSSLTKILNRKRTTIDTIVGKMEDSKHDLIQRVKTKQKTKGKIPQILFSLTETGIKTLLQNQYEKNKKPYLNVDELYEFILHYDDYYLKQKKTKEFPEWKKPKFTKLELYEIYKKANPYDEKIVNLRFGNYLKPNHKKLVIKLKDLYKKIEEAEYEFNQAMYETLVYEFGLNKKKK